QESLDKYKILYEDKNKLDSLPKCSNMTNTYVNNILESYDNNHINKNNFRIFLGSKIDCQISNNFTPIDTETLMLTNNQRLQKIIIQPGEGPLLQPGEEVSVNYVGMLLNNRKIFDQNPENKPFTFILGQGQVISGWDIGISSMKKGEISMLLLAPEYGYGSEGYPPEIPPNSGLIFFIKVI
ncbi:FKBP-type peptidyl-prolyl cis-trans isomerase, partial [Aureispira]|nr:FKBP-type peptidyl-prolyl cis-trans isomerase [Aureispira sp.]